MEKLQKADSLLTKQYKAFLSGKDLILNSKQQSLIDINKYFNDLKEAFEDEHKKNLIFINNYFNKIEREFNEVDELLQNNKRIVDKGINYINILMKQNFMEVKISDQLQLIDELKLNSLLDDKVNNKINLLLFQIKNNLLIPKINIDNKVFELVQQINNCFSIIINNKYSNLLNNSNINLNLNNIIEENNNDKNNQNISSTSVFLNNNSIYIEEKVNELQDLIEDLCIYINKMELTPKFIWLEPYSKDIYKISIINNKINAEKIIYDYIGNNLNKNFLFNEDFRVTNIYKNLIYITGGINNNKEILNNVYEYSLIKSCLSEKSSMNQKRMNHGSILIGDNIYVCGGVGENYNFLNSCEKYDIKENKWIYISPMNEKLFKFNLVQIDNKAFAAFGGKNENNIFNYKIHYYRIDSNNWFILDNFRLPYGLIYPGLCKISSKYILILGGINENNQESNEILKMDITSGNIGKFNKFLDINGYCIYSCIYNHKEIHLLLNHRNQKYPDRTILYI